MGIRQTVSRASLNPVSVKALNYNTFNKDWGLAVAEGRASEWFNVNKFGNAPDFDTGDNQVTVWDGANDALLGGAAMDYTYSSTADIGTISSSNAGDTQDIEVQGLDTNWDIVNQTVTLTGQTDASLTTNLIRVFRMKNMGSTDIAGVVYLRTNGSGQASGIPSTANTVRSLINGSSNQTEMAIYSVPDDYTAFISGIYASTSGAIKATNYVVKLWVRPFGGVFQLKHRRAISDSKDLERIFPFPEKVVAKSDIMITSQIDASGVTAGQTAAGFDLAVGKI